MGTMKSRLLASVACLLAGGYAVDAHAQAALVIPSCNGLSLGNGNGPLTMTPGGLLCVSAAFSGTVTTAATAASTPPTYSAGANPLSQTLKGGLRVQLNLAGTDIGLGQQLSAASMPVVLPSDQTVTVGGTVQANAGTNLNTSLLATAANQEVTAAGTSAASAQGVQGVTGGIALPISAASLPLPTSAATAANQEVTQAGTSAASAQGVQGVTGGIALPVSAASLPLPAGAATSANQANLNIGFIVGTSTAFEQCGTSSGTAAVTMVAGSGSLHAYLTDMQVFRNDVGTTMANITVNTANALNIGIPASGGNNPHFSVPVIASSTASVTFTNPGTIGSIVACAEGYFGT